MKVICMKSHKKAIDRSTLTLNMHSFVFEVSRKSHENRQNVLDKKHVVDKEKDNRPLQHK